MHERICTSCSEHVSKCVCWCSRHLSDVTTCTCMVLTTLVEVHFTLSAKNVYALVHARICNDAEASLPWNYCELILSLARASCRLLFAARPTAVSTKPVAWRCSLKKSVQIHASSWRGRRFGVAQASFDHPRWCRPHPICPWVALALGHGGRSHFIKDSMLAFFSRDFQRYYERELQWGQQASWSKWKRINKSQRMTEPKFWRTRLFQIRR